MIKNILINFITKHIFNLVNEKDILHVEGANVFFKGNKLSREQKQALVASANELLSNECFQILMNEMNFVINKKIHQADTMEGFRASKAMLWTIDVLQKKVDNISKIT